MNKLFLGIFIVVAFLLIHPAPTFAADKTADSSAVISRDQEDTETRIKTLAIQRVLKRNNSPLAENAEDFVRVAHDNLLDPYMLPAIAGVESGFGRALISGSHNPFGWGGGRLYFKSWNEGIETVGEGLHTRYFGRGAESVYDVGPMYAGGSHTWAPKVLAYMRVFEREEARIRRLAVL